MGLKKLAGAQEAFGTALRGYERLRKPFLAIGAQAGLAQVAYQRGDLPAALAYVEEILHYVTDHPVAGSAERAQLYLTCATVLDTSGDDRAAAVAALGAQQLRDQAAAINDPTLRQGLLEVATNRTLLESTEKTADLYSITQNEALVS
jgi:ATP/maltotriose-dependent transcriptional regulator MalT